MFNQYLGLIFVTHASPQKSFPNLSKDGLSVEPTIFGPEHPSPVSVLDASFYKEDLPPSPVKRSENLFKGKVLGFVSFISSIGTGMNRNGILSECELHMQGNCVTKYHCFFPTTVDANLLLLKLLVD